MSLVGVVKWGMGSVGVGNVCWVNNDVLYGDTTHLNCKMKISL